GRRAVVASDTGGAFAFSTFGPQPFSWQVGGQNSNAGTWAAPLQLSIPVTPTTNPTPSMPALASSGDGNAVLAWHEATTTADHHGHYLLRARALAGGSASWGDSRLVFERTSVINGRVGLQAAPGPAGNAVLAWDELRGGADPGRPRAR